MKKWHRNGLVSVVWVDLLGLVGGGKRRKAWSMVLRVRFGVELRGVRCLLILLRANDYFAALVGTGERMKALFCYIRREKHVSS